MKNQYSFIGAFELEGGSMLVADPYVNGITVALERIPSDNEISVSIPNMKKGVYLAYHVVDPVDGAIVSLLLSHKDTIIGKLEQSYAYPLGNVKVSLGNAVVAVDKDHLFDTTSCYYSFSENAYYSCDRLMKEIPEMDYPDAIKEELSELIQTAAKEGLPAVSGSSIAEVLGASPVWEGFRGFCRDSTLWSVEILEGLSCAYKNAETIKGGVASLTGADIISVYRYADLDDKTLSSAVLISLCIS